jgi:hypothetical protein
MIFVLDNETSKRYKHNHCSIWVASSRGGLPTGVEMATEKAKSKTAATGRLSRPLLSPAPKELGELDRLLSQERNLDPYKAFKLARPFFHRSDSSLAGKNA